MEPVTTHQIINIFILFICFVSYLKQSWFMRRKNPNNKKRTASISKKCVFSRVVPVCLCLYLFICISLFILGIGRQWFHFRCVEHFPFYFSYSCLLCSFNYVGYFIVAAGCSSLNFLIFLLIHSVFLDFQQRFFFLNIRFSIENNKN